MIRKAFVMQVNADAHEEYQRRHNPIWPELEAVLKSTARITTRFISIRSAICCSPPLRLNPRALECRCQHRRLPALVETYA